MAQTMIRRTKFVLDEDRRSRAPGTTSRPTCPCRRRPSSIPAPASRSGRATWRRCSRWSSSSRSSAPSATSRSPTRSATPTRSTGRARCSARTAWRRRSRRPPTSTTSTRAAARRAATSRTRPSRRPTTTRPGVTRLATETGAGQWGSALALAGALRARRQGLHGPRQYDQKPYRRILMETYGARSCPAPARTPRTAARCSAETPGNTGSLGMAISEAIEDTVTHPGTKYSLGSVFDFVLLHQTVIGQESIEQMGWPARSPTSSSAAPAAARTSPG